MSATKPERRTVLGEDGEIRDLDSLLNEPDAESSAEHAEHESLYCTRCGAANPPDASYCARCGKALIEPGLPSDEMKRKRKRDMGPLPDYLPVPMRMPMAPMPGMASQPGAAGEFNFWGMISRLVMLTFVAGMVITSMIPFHGQNNAAMAIFALLAWFLVEAVRQGKHNRMNMWSMIIEVVTLTFVTGMVITSFVFNVGTLGLVVLVAWFLTEAVRN
ncbi:MAG: zinc-ribbon domain-containing protein [Aggregatilineales bacterium]